MESGFVSAPMPTLRGGLLLLVAGGLGAGLTGCSDPTTDAASAENAGMVSTLGPRDADVDAIFSDLTADGPGAAVVVRQDGVVVHRAGYGIAHLDHGIPITPATVFDIASISKQFGAMSALLLEADGTLDLDADVRTLVPELPDFGYVITPRHLLHHVSGIRDWPHAMGLGGVEMSDVISFEKILRMLFRQQSLNFPPGSEYAYSNTGYNLLALTIERASGMTFREFTRERIFGPLGMVHTHFSDNYNEVVPGRAESYAPGGGGRGESRDGDRNDARGGEAGWERRVNQLTALASSSLNTTIDDFSLWMENYETAQVGGREIIDRMTERGVLTGGDTIAYAFGLTVGEYRGLSNFGHGGSWAGYRTNFLRFPEQDLSVAVFCNFSTCDPGRRAVEAAEVYLESLMQPAERVGPDRRQSEPVSLSAAQLAEYTGQFRSPELDSTYDLFVEDGALVAKHWRGAPIGFSPTGEDTFTSEHPWFPEVRFIRDGRGRVTSFTVTGVRVRHLLFELR